MKLTSHNITLFVLLFIFHFTSRSQNYSPKIKSFKAGEILEYDVLYNWGLLWVSAGTVTFSVQQELIKEKSLYHFTGEGNSKKNWDWFFKVRDKFESYNDSTTLRPFKYIRNSNDGGEWVYNDVTFDHKNNKAIGYIKSKKQPALKIDTMQINYLTFDPISMIYYARTIDFDKFNTGDEIPITIMLDNQIFYRKIVYLGKEIVITDFGKFRCIKFKPTLIPGTLFKEGDAMTVWVSDDENRIPIKVETPIVVGSVKAYLKKVSGIRHQMRKLTD